MGFFDRLTSSFSSANQGVKLVEQWCAELGWGIDSRIDSTSLILDFKDPLCGIRKLLITVGESGRMAGLSVFSVVDLHVRQLSGKLMAYLLHRNNDMLGAWGMKIKDDGSITLCVAHTLVLQGMDAGLFRTLTQELLKEANDLDTKMNNSEF
jgi:hypothetical protein